MADNDYDGPLFDDIRNESLNDFNRYLPTDKQQRYAVALIKYFVPDTAALSRSNIFEQPLKPLFGIKDINDTELLDFAPDFEEPEGQEIPDYGTFQGGKRSRRSRRRMSHRRR
jgi:hypothetical protein